jgi:hypothetical protein
MLACSPFKKMGHAQFKSIGMDKTIQMKGVMGGMNT